MNWLAKAGMAVALPFKSMDVTKVAACTGGVVAIAVVGAACQPGDTWIDATTGNRFTVIAQGQIVEYAETHVDSDPCCSAWDRTCRLLGGCPGWQPPMDHYWHLHRWHTLLTDPFGNPYWWVHDEDWHNFLNCIQFSEMEGQWECHQNDPIAVSAPRG